jgi:hypothetical protein
MRAQKEAQCSGFALTTPASLEEIAMQLICAFGSLRGR